MRFGRDKFDLIITDYKMPKMNGLELIERIREVAADASHHPASPATPMRWA